MMTLFGKVFCKMSKSKKLSVLGVVLIIFSVVFGFSNSPMAFYRMGYGSIPCYLFCGIAFFIPIMFMVAEYSSAFKNDHAGIYTWLRSSMGELYATLGAFIFYFSYFTWMIFVVIEIWIPISAFLFGEDTTQSWSVFGWNATQTIGFVAILFMIFITVLATRGFDKISVIARFGGSVNATINIILYSSSFILLILTKGEFAQPIEGISSFVSSPNAEHGDIFFVLGFVVFALFAYGGPESLSSLVEKAKSPKVFAKGVLISAILITVGYSLSIFCWGISYNWNDLISAEGVNMGNITYVVMGNLGYKLGLAMGWSNDLALSLGGWFTRAVGFSVCMTFMGAFFALIYAPLKTILEGAPKGFWPEFVIKKNRFDMPYIAMWIQTFAVCVVVFLMSFSGQGAQSFYQTLILLSNVANALPYLFLSMAFPVFRNNSSLNHSYKLFKSKFSVYVATVLVFCIDLFANIFIVILPIIHEESNALSQVLWMVGGPAVILTIALVMFFSYRRRSKVKDE